MRLNPLKRVRREMPQQVPAKAHFLHIGKCGGSAINAALYHAQDAGRYEIVYDGHDVSLEQIPMGEKFFFVLRDPLERYVSSFNDRQRCSRPRYDIAWSAGEERAYRRFHTPDELGRALSSPDESLRAAAQDAMRSIYHVRHSYWHWFVSPEVFRSRLPDLLLVMWLPSLATGFERLCRILGARAANLPTDETGAHRRPADSSTSLSETATENLRRWYQGDYQFVDMCGRLDQAVPELRAAWPAAAAHRHNAHR